MLHNFVSFKETKIQELYTSKEGGWLKAINFTTKPLQGEACGVTPRIGTWQDTINFTMEPIDDFKVMLGMDFLRKIKAM